MGHDLRYALRRLLLRPAHSAIVALTLGLGIGTSLAVFAVVDAVLVRPLPYPAPGRLVRITQQVPMPGFPELSFSDVAYRSLMQDGRTLAAAAAWQTRDANLVRGDESRRLVVAGVSASLFDVLRVAPTLGRAFTSDEDLPSSPRVVVLADWLWRSAFNADSTVLGRVVTLEGEPVTIVGVLRGDVAFPSRDIAAWEPLRLDPAGINPYQNAYGVVGRLRDGVSLDAARTGLTEPLRTVGRQYPGPHPGSALDPAGYFARVQPLADAVTGDVRPVVLLLLGGVVLLLLLTCANVANLQLASVIGRGEELAVRAAMGATRSRLIRGALIEGIVLAGAGAILGLLVAGVGTGLLATLIPQGSASGGSLLGARMLAATVVVVLLVGAAVGALPVAIVSGRDLSRGLRDRAAGASTLSANGVRRALAAAQVAMAILLLHGSGLLVLSARAAQQVRLGFEPAELLTMRINLPDATLRDRNAREALLRRISGEIAQLPGITASGLVNALPLTPGRQDLAMAVEGRPFKADGTDPMADYRVASSGYFAAMRIPLRSGRVFTDDDAGPTSTPVVISERLARILFPDGEDAVGHRLRFGPASPWMPIIGVVGDARNRSVTEDPRPELYVPGLGTWSNLAFRTEISIVARGRGDAMALAAPIRRVVNGAAPDVAIYNLFTMDEVVRDARARMTVATRLMSGYAVAALLLAVAGIYAVLSYLVTQRRHELAVRMALGASPRAIVGLIARESALLVSMGAAAGMAGALLSSRLLSGLLYGVGALDLGALVLVALGAVATGLAAGLLPARRATRTDPSASLRAG